MAKRRPRKLTGRRAAGFTLMELLVTIVMAGIIFAAMVPLFLSAEVKSSSDQMRTVAMNLAQDRIEKIRQLPFDQLYPTRA